MQRVVIRRMPLSLAMSPSSTSNAAIDNMMNLNLMGSILPSQVFGEVMATAGKGCILNVSSMATVRTLACAWLWRQRQPSTTLRWLALEMAFKYGEGMRVKTVAPGFFIGEQNRQFLLNPDDTLTTCRGQQIIDHTPMKRFGEADELVGTAVWLCSDAAKFVTGIVVPVDGGFSTYSGV